MALKIALIGYGAIARAMCDALDGDAGIAITQILVRPERLDALSLAMPPEVQAIGAVEDISPDCNFVLECAGHDAVRSLGPAILGRGLDLGIVSSGVLADDDVLGNLQRSARHARSRCIIVPGAIGGIDALAAAGSALAEVTYTSVKSPHSWKGSPAEKSHDLDGIDAPTVLFSGSAREAALTYPKNANVVATVALAGIGFDRTRVTLTADPAAKGNTHRIRAGGSGYDLDYKSRGAALADNPRTSALTALSARRTLRQRGFGILV